MTAETGAQEGGSALVETAWLGILLLLPMVWIVMAVAEVQAGAFAVSAAARSAGRAFALAPDDETGRLWARAAADVALADQGVEGIVEVGCGRLPDCHVGGAVVTVRVATSVDLPFVPDFLGGRASFALDAEHRVPIGQYHEPGAGP